MKRRRPTYALAEFQRRVLAGSYVVTRSAREGAAALGFDESDVIACVLALTERDFYKTMESEQFPELWQDVYRPTYRHAALYVKLQLSVIEDAVVISFKEL